MLPDPKGSLRPTGLSLRDNLENCLNEEKQMTEMVKTATGASSVCAADWISIDWNQANVQVKQLQELRQSASFAMAANTLIFCQAFGSKAGDSKFRG